MLRALLTLVSAALLLPALAAGGGFATVQLDSLPAGTAAGGTWTPTLTVLQHGVTPLDGITPVVRVSSGTDVREFPAQPTGRPGEYRVDVEFPSAGTWRYEIDDGFSQTHTYAPVTIATPAGGGGSVLSPWLWAVVGVAAAALFLVALVPLARRRAGVTRRAAPAG
jgi:hypothetical protein